MHFSDLTDEFPGARNRLYERLEEIRQQGATITDLVRGNVHEAGIVFPQDTLAEALAHAAVQARIYAPDSFGQPVAREAIAAYHDASPDRILLTPGTSVSYWYIFKLLCEPGDEILCPAPSYPLFDYIARLADIEIAHYPLDPAAAWAIDLEGLERAVTRRTRAVVIISPHNPTGMVAGREQLEALAAIARRHRLPLILDEVFREFVFDDAAWHPLARTEAPLVFTLNGLSKMFALPGLKIGWVAVSGDAALVRKSMATLEMISDTFLPVNEIAQFAAPEIFRRGEKFLAEHRSRIQYCRDRALAALGGVSAPPRGGFYMTLPYGRDLDEEDLAMELLEEERVLVHPGYFYDVGGRHLVFSFVGDPDAVGDALTRVQPRLASGG